MTRRPVTAGRGDLAERAETIMGKMRDQAAEDEAAGIGREPEREVVDTLYYAHRKVVRDPMIFDIEHQALVLRGMHERVPMFECRAPTERRLERAIVSAYLDALLNVGMAPDEARRRAGTCKLELVDQEMVPLYARGSVTVGGRMI